MTLVNAVDDGADDDLLAPSWLTGLSGDGKPSRTLLRPQPGPSSVPEPTLPGDMRQPSQLDRGEIPETDHVTSVL
jgi:hypothetical protein